MALSQHFMNGEMKLAQFAALTLRTAAHRHSKAPQVPTSLEAHSALCASVLNRQQDVVVEAGVFHVSLPVNSIVTITSLRSIGAHGVHPASPEPQPFPFPYAENFEGETLTGAFPCMFLELVSAQCEQLSYECECVVASRLSERRQQHCTLFLRHERRLRGDGWGTEAAYAADAHRLVRPNC
eukprot:SAG22_NODE_212_length_15072_cov_3.109197_2_plen_182_part_00